MKAETKEFHRLSYDEEEVLDVDGAASLTKRTKGTIYVLVHQRKIPHSKPLNGKLRFFRSELLSWMKSFSVPVKQEG